MADVCLQCDQKKPSCGQCKLSRIPCGGYDQPHIFVNSGLEHDGGSDGSHRFENVRYSIARASFVQRELTSLDGMPPHNGTRGYRPAFAWSRIAQPNTLQRSLERTALESNYLNIYWTSLLPHGHAFPPQAGHYSTTRWTDATQDLYHEDPLVRNALLANALSRVAQKTGDLSLMAQGWRLYGISLQTLAHLLRDRNMQDWGRTLAVSGLLASYEVRNACVILKVLFVH